MRKPARQSVLDGLVAVVAFALGMSAVRPTAVPPRAPCNPHTLSAADDDTVSESAPTTSETADRAETPVSVEAACPSAPVDEMGGPDERRATVLDAAPSSADASAVAAERALDPTGESLGTLESRWRWARVGYVEPAALSAVDLELLGRDLEGRKPWLRSVAALGAPPWDSTAFQAFRSFQFGLGAVGRDFVVPVPSFEIPSPGSPEHAERVRLLSAAQRAWSPIAARVFELADAGAHVVGPAAGYLVRDGEVHVVRGTRQVAEGSDEPGRTLPWVTADAERRLLDELRALVEE